MSAPRVSVVIPCLNEERHVGECVRRAKKALASIQGGGEVVVVDNGSTDASAAKAKAAGARVVSWPVKGYGSALKKGFTEAKGRFLIMGDADTTYDFSEIPKFVKLLESGAELVMGSRLRGRVERGAMPWLHRYLGTPVLTAILNVFFGTRISDANCGMRGLTREAFVKLGLKCRGMEFASEMVVKAAQKRLRIAETPIDYHANLARVPKLHTFRDGWRHLRFMLVLCPKYLFLLPGFVLTVVGAGLSVLLFNHTVYVFQIPLGLSAVVFANALVFLGIQVTLFGVYAIIFNISQGLMEPDRVSRWVNKYFKLEWGLALGALLGLAGLGLGAATISLLVRVSYSGGMVNVPITRLAIASTFVFLLGLQVFFSSFYLSLFNLNKTLE